MSQEQFHDLLSQLKQESRNDGILEHEHRHRLDEVIESLEQQKLYPEEFDQFSALAEQLKEIAIAFEGRHPRVSTILNSISQLLNNFKA